MPNCVRVRVRIRVGVGVGVGVGVVLEVKVIEFDVEKGGDPGACATSS